MPRLPTICSECVLCMNRWVRNRGGRRSSPVFARRTDACLPCRMNSIKLDCERAVSCYLVLMEPTVVAQGAAYGSQGLDRDGYESGI